MKKLLLLFITTSFVLSQNLIESVSDIYENGNIKAISYHQKIWQKIELVKKETYYENGQMAYVGNYKDGNVVKRTWYNEDGSINKEGEITEIWDKAIQLREDEKLMESINSFKSIIKDYPLDDLAAKAQFQIADIYLNDTKDFEFAVEEFEKVVKEYPEHEVSKKSLFMIAYIYNNYLEAYSDAIINYNLFKERYPADELIPSVEYELEGLKNIKATIDSLNSIVNKKTEI